MEVWLLCLNSSYFPDPAFSATFEATISRWRRLSSFVVLQRRISITTSVKGFITKFAQICKALIDCSLFLWLTINVAECDGRQPTRARKLMISDTISFLQTFLLKILKNERSSQNAYEIAERDYYDHSGRICRQPTAGWTGSFPSNI